jgi:hypothetical protein
LVAIETYIFKIQNEYVITKQVINRSMLTSQSKITIGCKVKILTFSFIKPEEEIIIA